MARRQLLKAINRSSILNIIKAHGAIARADIARLTQLSPAAVTLQTAELIHDGLIFEKTEGDSRGGRRPILLALNPEGIYVVGIKLAEQQATLALTDLNAEIIARAVVDLTSAVPEEVAHQLRTGIDRLMNQTSIPHSRIVGVGVGMAGLIDSARGICRLSPFNGWHDVPFADLLAEQLDFPVYLDNDVNTLTQFERVFGPGQHVSDFLVVTLGRGVGMGIVTNGQIYRGTRGSGGEFGHTVIDPEGFVCQCGNRGCLETFVADPWLVRRARVNGLNVAGPDNLVQAAQQSERVALQVLAAAGQVLGRGIASLINIFNPAMIVISGEGLRAGDYVFDAMHAAIRQHTFGQLLDDVEIRIEPLDDGTWARGAASLVLGRVFHAPQLQHTPGGS